MKSTQSSIGNPSQSTVKKTGAVAFSGLVFYLAHVLQQAQARDQQWLDESTVATEKDNEITDLQVHLDQTNPLVQISEALPGEVPVMAHADLSVINVVDNDVIDGKDAITIEDDESESGSLLWLLGGAAVIGGIVAATSDGSSSSSSSSSAGSTTDEESTEPKSDWVDLYRGDEYVSVSREYSSENSGYHLSSDVVSGLEGMTLLEISSSQILSTTVSSEQLQAQKNQDLGSDAVVRNVSTSEVIASANEGGYFSKSNVTAAASAYLSDQLGLDENTVFQLVSHFNQNGELSACDNFNDEPVALIAVTGEGVSAIPFSKDFSSIDSVGSLYYGPSSSNSGAAPYLFVNTYFEDGANAMQQPCLVELSQDKTSITAKAGEQYQIEALTVINQGESETITYESIESDYGVAVANRVNTENNEKDLIFLPGDDILRYIGTEDEDGGFLGTAIESLTTVSQGLQDDGSTMYFDSSSARVVQGGFLVEYAMQENATEKDGVAYILDGKPEDADVSTIASTFSLKDFGSIKDILDTNPNIDGDNKFLTLTEDGLIRRFIIEEPESSDGASSVQYELNAKGDALAIRSLSPVQLSMDSIDPTISLNDKSLEIALAFNHIDADFTQVTTHLAVFTQEERQTLKLHNENLPLSEFLPEYNNVTSIISVGDGSGLRVIENDNSVTDVFVTPLDRGYGFTQVAYEMAEGSTAMNTFDALFEVTSSGRLIQHYVTESDKAASVEFGIGSDLQSVMSGFQYFLDLGEYDEKCYVAAWNYDDKMSVLEINEEEKTASLHSSSHDLTAINAIQSDIGLDGLASVAIAFEEDGATKVSAGVFSHSSTWLSELIGKGSALEGDFKTWDLTSTHLLAVDETGQVTLFDHTDQTVDELVGVVLEHDIGFNPDSVSLTRFKGDDTPDFVASASESGFVTQLGFWNSDMSLGSTTSFGLELPEGMINEIDITPMNGDDTQLGHLMTIESPLGVGISLLSPGFLSDGVDLTERDFLNAEFSSMFSDGDNDLGNHQLLQYFFFNTFRSGFSGDGNPIGADGSPIDGYNFSSSDLVSFVEPDDLSTALSLFGVSDISDLTVGEWEAALTSFGGLGSLLNDGDLDDFFQQD
tara:strand:+ start:902 stop:4219 length:3318 start_codon:yes stop_codon:yes gene_type:complete